MASPTNSTMDVAIGAVIGGLIPIFVVLFGYVEGQLVDSQTNTEPAPEEKVIENNELAKKIQEFEKTKFGPLIRGYKRDNGHLSIREIAEHFNIPQEEVQRYLDEGREYE